MVATKKSGELLFYIEDTPPWYLSMLFGAQHCITMVGATFLVPLIISVPLGIESAMDKGYLICTVLFVSGISTLLQSTVGVRLPIIQGATFAFLGPTFAILSSPQWAVTKTNVSYANSNSTDSPTTANDEITWHDRICELQGAIIVASCCQIVFGACGLIGILVRFISPITLTAIVTLVGLGLFYPAVKMAAEGWPVSLLTSLILIICWQYLSRVNVPCPCAKTPSLRRFPLFSSFPIIISVIVSWTLCVILTETNVFSTDPADYSFKSRTDTYISVLIEAPWFRVPYPFQWGWPTFSFTSIIGMFTAAVAGMIESISDYFAAARLSGAPPPPKSALNRGSMMEGIGCLIAGIIGSGNATTSYSENVGAIAVTRVGSRRVIQTAALIILFLGVLSKFGALFATCPTPIAGGILMVMFGVITSVGLSNLQYVDLNSFRNLFVIGTSIFCGLAIPFYIQQHKSTISTGSDTADQIVYIVLGTNMLVGGSIAIFLDLTLPGTLEERGLVKWKQQAMHAEADPSDRASSSSSSTNTYDFPFGMAWVRKSSVMRKIPFSPTFGLHSDSDSKNHAETEKFTTKTEAIDKDGDIEAY